MIEKIKAKQKQAPILKLTGTIITTVALIIMTFMLLSGKDFAIPIAVSIVVFMYSGIILLIIYFTKYYVFEKNMRMLSKCEKSLEELISETENSVNIPGTKIICTENALIFEKQKWVIPYESIVWVYKNIVKGAYGLITVETNLIIHTTTGEKFKINGISDAALLWLIDHFRHRFYKDFILGYGALQYKKFKEITKKETKDNKMKENKSMEEQAAALSDREKENILKIAKYGTIGLFVFSIPIIILLIINLIGMITDPLFYTYKAINGFVLTAILSAAIIFGFYAFIKIKFPYYNDKLATYINKNENSK